MCVRVCRNTYIIYLCAADRLTHVVVRHLNGPSEVTEPQVP